MNEFEPDKTPHRNLLITCSQWKATLIAMNRRISPVKLRGRPREFDRDEVLERAMNLFWSRGCEATSGSDLTQAMGITPPSLYGTFGDKKRLFLEAVDRYRAGPGAFAQRA